MYIPMVKREQTQCVLETEIYLAKEGCRKKSAVEISKGRTQ